MNAFGVDVRGLDVPAFLAGARHLFPLLALAWLAVLLRVRRAGWLLLGVVLANAYVWFETSWPLQRLYALGPSSDRVNNLALCQVVAAGHSPLYTPQVGTMHFEPFWAVVTAVLSGWSPDRLLAIYPFLPLVMACGLALSLYFALRPAGPGAPDGAWSSWERAIVVGFATLLASDALDYAGSYRVPWAMTFLLKPNHALGLVLAPWVARRIALARGWRDRLLAGVLLHLLAWAFVIHMGVFCIGLVALVAMAFAWRRDEARRNALDVAVAIGVNLLVVSPYLVMLFRGYGVFQHGPRLEIPPGSPHLLEATTRVAPLFALAVWGAVVAWRRDRMGRVWAAQLVGAFLLWLSYFALHFLQQAKERDDAYYWLRTMVAICAALGAWDLARRVPRLLAPWARAAAVGLVVLPLALPYWYDPPRMDLYFDGSLQPLPETVRAPIAFLRSERARVGVLAGDPVMTRWAAALGGFQVLLAKDFQAPPDYMDRVRIQLRFVTGEPGAGAPRYPVTHLLVTRELLEMFPAVTLDDLRARPDLRLVHLTRGPDGAFVAVFEVRGPA